MELILITVLIALMFASLTGFVFICILMIIEDVREWKGRNKFLNIKYSDDINALLKSDEM